jgi:N-acetylmuramic acid 6-phosphate etherase
MISTTSMVKSNKVYKNYMVDLKVSNKKLKERALSIICEITKLKRENSLKLLNEAKNDVKIALVIHHCKISYNSARKLINSNNGNLRKILE